MIDIATLTAEPLLVAPTHARSLAASLAREPAPYDHAADVAAVYGVMMPAQEKPFTFAEGVAYIPVRGTLINRSTASYSFMTGYKGIVSRVAAAAADPQVKGVVFDVDSYGGEAAGCFEAAQYCRAALMASGKPSMAMVDSNAYSAGFAMAVAADRVVVVPSGGAGSIGVVTMHVDYSKALDKDGVSVEYIYAGKHKVDGNPYEPLPAAARASIQKRIDDRYSAFAEHVDTMRGLPAGSAAKTEAQIYSAADALALGLIDEISSAPEALAKFTLSISEATSSFQLEAHMADPQVPDVAAVQSEARTAERARVKAIMTNAEADGRGDLASYLAFDTDMSAEQAGAMLSKAPKAHAPAPAAAAAPASNPLAAAMAAAGTPGIAPDGAEAPAAGADTSAAQTNALLSALTLATGRKVG